MPDKSVIIIGAGAAGMMAAVSAADAGRRVFLFDGNEKPGKKLYLTGKGRCNVTNACEVTDVLSSVLSHPKFLYSALYAFPPDAVMDFFKKQGCPLKVERGRRVFPQSDRSSDVIKALQNALLSRGVTVRLLTKVSRLLFAREPNKTGWDDGTLPGQGGSDVSPLRVTGVQTQDGQKILADHVIIATGGLSYPSTGSTGDGYRLAQSAGHTIVPVSPSLVPMNVSEEWAADLAGLSLRNAAISLYDQNHLLYRDFGEMLFTHFGVSGPMILSASAAADPSAFARPLSLLIDVKPALSSEQLDRRLIREFDAQHAKAFHNALGGLYPAKLIPVLVRLCGIDPQKRAGDVTKEERRRLGELTKNLPLTVNGLRGFSEAVVTKGGVNTLEVDPYTMRSKVAQGLSFAGEVLDLDAQTGGYNLQIAWSTGYLAGSSLREET